MIVSSSIQLPVISVFLNCHIIFHHETLPHLNYPFISDGHLDCFQFLAVRKGATVNMDELVSLEYIVESFVYIPKSGVAHLMVSLFSAF